MVGPGRIAKVSSGTEITVLIRKDSFQHEDLFAQRVTVPRKRGARIVADNARGVTAFGLLTRKRLAPHARHRALLPRTVERVDRHTLRELHVEHDDCPPESEPLEIPRVKPQMVLDESRDEKVAVVIALLHPQFERN